MARQAFAVQPVHVPDTRARRNGKALPERADLNTTAAQKALQIRVLNPRERSALQFVFAFGVSIASICDSGMFRLN